MANSKRCIEISVQEGKDKLSYTNKGKIISFPYALGGLGRGRVSFALLGFRLR